MSKDVMNPDGKSFPLEDGQMTTVCNPNPATMEMTFEMTRGSLITFTVPAGGSFTVKSCGDFTRAVMNVLDVTTYGPRPVDND